MTSIGSFLLWFPLVLGLSFVLIFAATEIGFQMEADNRGFHGLGQNDRDGIYEKNSYINGCFVFGINGTKFCKSDYGILGFKNWMDQKDKKTFYGIFDKNSIDVPQNICKERVVSYNLTKSNESMTLSVKCNN